MIADLSNVLFFMHGEYRNLQLALIAEIKKSCRSSITLVCKTTQDRDFYEKNSKADKVIPLSLITGPRALSGKELFEAARTCEEKYQINFHHLLVDERYYFSGAPHFPLFQKRTYQENIASIQSRFMYYETLFQESGFSLVCNPDHIADIVAAHCGIPRRHFHSCLYKNYYVWFDSFSRESAAIKDKMSSLTSSESGRPLTLEPLPSYQVVRDVVLKNINLRNLIRSIFYEILRDLYYRCRRYEKVTKHGFSGWKWARYMLRQRRAYFKLKKIATVRWEEIKSLSYVFYPLASEPEATLAFCSPKYLDQLSIIQSIATALPVGYYCVVKEHVIAVGNRSGEFYEVIAGMPNVILVDVLDRGVDLISTSRAVVTIGSTAGMEAAIMGIPVLLYGEHNFYDFLPHVTKVTSWYDLPETLRQILSNGAQRREEYRRAAKKLTGVLENYGVNLDSIADPSLRAINPQAGRTLLDSLEASLSAANPLNPSTGEPFRYR